MIYKATQAIVLGKGLEPRSPHARLAWFQLDPRVCTSYTVSMCRIYCHTI